MPNQRGETLVKKLAYILIAVIMIFGSFSVSSLAHEKPEEISINDYAGVLADSAKSYIKSKNDILYSHTEAKIVFVTTESTEGMNISEYCEFLYSDWGISRLGRRNSIFIVIDASSKEYDFIRGNNLRYAITDAEIYKYMVEYFEPYFAEGSYNQAVLSLYNALGKWYEQHYNSLSLGLDENVDRYSYGEKNKDEDKEESKLWLWIAIAVCVTVLIIALKIKRNIELKIRQHERRRLKKKFQIDIDKIVNS